MQRVSSVDGRQSLPRAGKQQSCTLQQQKLPHRIQVFEEVVAIQMMDKQSFMLLLGFTSGRHPAGVHPAEKDFPHGFGEGPFGLLIQLSGRWDLADIAVPTSVNHMPDALLSNPLFSTQSIRLLIWVISLHNFGHVPWMMGVFF